MRFEEIADLESAPAQDVLRWAYGSQRRVAIVASFQAESGVLIDMACEIVESPEVLTLDTRRLPQKTFAYMDRMRDRYPMRLHVLQPDAGEVDAMTAAHGMDLFRDSIELRHQCCDVRKVRPLARALREYDAWITGVRRDQTRARSATAVVARDPANGDIIKAAPLARWTHDDVVSYATEHGIPPHPLYAEGYTSIGCAPCTRPTAPGEDERAGRWWWEHDALKECGLHQVALEAAL